MLMQGKELSLADPPIIVRLHIAYPLAILLQDDDCLPWFYSHYIQLLCIDDVESHYNIDFSFDDTGVEWSGCYWLSSMMMNKVMLDANKIALRDFIKSSIDQEYYVYTHADDYYIPHRESFQIEHYRHVILIFGYHEEDQSYDIIGFDEKGQYRTSKVSYDTFDQAYPMDSPYDPLVLLRKRQSGHYDFDCQLVAEQLDDYLNSRNPIERHRIFRNPGKDYVYGMTVYKRLRRYLERLMLEDIWCDFRNLHLVWEHKKCMLRRIQYMIEHGYLSSNMGYDMDYEVIERKSVKMRNMMMKFAARKDPHIIQRIMDMLDTMVEDERVILTRILEEIRN